MKRVSGRAYLALPYALNPKPHLRGMDRGPGLTYIIDKGKNQGLKKEKDNRLNK
jgi:hypothetical protein